MPFCGSATWRPKNAVKSERISDDDTNERNGGSHEQSGQTHSITDTVEEQKLTVGGRYCDLDHNNCYCGPCHSNWNGLVHVEHRTETVLEVARTERPLMQQRWMAVIPVKMFLPLFRT